MTTDAVVTLVRQELATAIIDAVRWAEQSLDTVSSGQQVPHLAAVLAANAHCRRRCKDYPDETVGSAVFDLLRALDDTEIRLLAACRRDPHDDSARARAATQDTIRRATASLGLTDPGGDAPTPGPVDDPSGDRPHTDASTAPPSFRANRARSPHPTSTPPSPAQAVALTGTRYPAALPQVPGNRWNIRSGTVGGDPDEGTAWAEFTTPHASTVQDAELQVLAYLDHDYEDDLRGAVAVASAAPGGYLVRVKFARAR